MNSSEFKKELEINFNLQLIVAGMTGLVDEGYTPHEVFELMETTKKNTYHALAELKRSEANEEYH